MFEELVGLIDKIKDDSIGEWIVDKENDGISRCIAKIYVRSLSFIIKKENEGKSKKQAKIAGLNKFLQIYYARVIEIYKNIV